MTVAGPPELVLRSACELGEGPVWRARDRSVWFVDIKGLRIHRFEPGTGAAWSWAAPAQPGFIAPTVRGDWIVGLKTGLHRFDPKQGHFELMAPVEDASLGNRLNDGFVDATGRLWFGSMDDGETALTGALYSLDSRGVRRRDAGYCITNGPAMSPDGRVLYHTDTLRKTIYAFDVAPSGDLSGKRVFAQIEEGAGYPDGPAVDAEGCVWTGLYAGWGLRRYSPSGEMLEFVRFPCANVTKPAFGGEDLKTIYATTAWKGLTADQRASQPLAGGLFCFPVGVPGLPQHEVAYG
jgi:sugar lactone lactonase YvrE